MSTRLAGAFWIMAGVVCAGLLSFVLIGEHVNDLGFLLVNLALPARVLGGALVAFLIGGLLLNRPGPNVVRWSSLAGIAWLFTFGPLVVTTIMAAVGGYEVGPVVSSSLITGLGIAGAVVGHLSRRGGDSADSDPGRPHGRLETSAVRPVLTGTTAGRSANVQAVRPAAHGRDDRAD